MASVFLLLVTKFEIFDFFFNFNTKVKGPGQNFLYNKQKSLFKIQSFSS